jgi:hypothetical protein
MAGLTAEYLDQTIKDRLGATHVVVHDSSGMRSRSMSCS